MPPEKSIFELVPDEAVGAANDALAEGRRLPSASMRAALLAALPYLAPASRDTNAPEGE